MTPAEQTLFDVAMRTDLSESEFVEQTDRARHTVLLERLPENFERNMIQLCTRFEDANRTLLGYMALHPLGREMQRRILSELRKRHEEGQKK